MSGWLTTAPTAARCKTCGQQAAYWDGGDGAAVCRPCLQDRTDGMALALVRHRQHARPVEGCVPCSNEMAR